MIFVGSAPCWLQPEPAAVTENGTISMSIQESKVWFPDNEDVVGLKSRKSRKPCSDSKRRRRSIAERTLNGSQGVDLLGRGQRLKISQVVSLKRGQG
jgi:hypothetical protein